MPVLYMTDRAATSKTFGTTRKMEVGTAIYNLHTGKFNCSVKNSLGKQIIEKTKQLDWKGTEKNSGLSITPFASSGTEKAYHEFGNAVIEAAEKSSSKEVFVIIHGYNTTFARAAKSAASLAYSVERPVIVFDWPSRGKLSQYDQDEGNNEWSQEHFDHLLEELKAVKDRSGIKFNLLAHSMGNRLIIRSAPVLKGQRLFEQMYLVDPDFDAETFVHYLVRYAKSTDLAGATAGGDKEEPTKVRILFSHRDRALPMAQCLFGGYTRLGQAADRMLSTVLNPISVTENFIRPKNETPIDTDSKQSESSEPSAPSAESVPALSSSWSMNFEWIDFTVLDYGLVGHTIPFQMISSLWSENRPGAGLKIVESTNEELNGLSKMFAALFRQKIHIPSKLIACKRVEFIKDDNKKLSGLSSAK